MAPKARFIASHGFQTCRVGPHFPARTVAWTGAHAEEPAAGRQETILPNQSASAGQFNAHAKRPLTCSRACKTGCDAARRANTCLPSFFRAAPKANDNTHPMTSRPKVLCEPRMLPRTENAVKSIAIGPRTAVSMQLRPNKAPSGGWRRKAKTNATAATAKSTARDSRTRSPSDGSIISLTLNQRRTRPRRPPARRPKERNAHWGGQPGRPRCSPFGKRRTTAPSHRSAPRALASVRRSARRR